MAKIVVNGVIRDMTDAETSFRASEVLDTAGQIAKALTGLRKERDAKLSETDYLALSDVTLSDSVKTWRQSLRDIPANHTDEDAYDLLLARDSDGKLTHSIWSKP